MSLKQYPHTAALLFILSHFRLKSQVEMFKLAEIALIHFSTTLIQQLKYFWKLN